MSGLFFSPCPLDSLRVRAFFPPSVKYTQATTAYSYVVFTIDQYKRAPRALLRKVKKSDLVYVIVVLVLRWQCSTVL